MKLAGLDVGTTGCKIAVFDELGACLKTYYQEYAVTRKQGEHEIDFNMIKKSVLSLLKEAAGEFHLNALGVTSFGETFVMLDEQDEVLAPSMLYTDPRGQEECAALCDLFGEETLTARTGVKPHPMYSIAKIAWLKNHQPQVFARCRRVLLGEDFIVYTLTGQAQIDYSLAARTAAFDIEKKTWIPEVFRAVGLDVKVMSQPVPAGQPAGGLRSEIRALLGIDYDITVVNGCHDQVAGMIGAGVFSLHQAMDGTGTVECIPVVLTARPSDPLFYEQGYCVVPYLNGQYACYAFSFTGGATLKWFRDTFAEAEVQAAKAAGENVYARLDAQVPTAPSGVLVLPHFAGAATPYMDNDAKAAMVGLTLETDKYTIYKALMEGTSYEMLLNFNALQSFTEDIREIRATGGGALSDVWLQIKADILGEEITALNGQEIGAAGTAALAGTAIGGFSSVQDAVSRMVTVRRVFTPNPENKERYAQLYRQYAGLYQALRAVRGE